MFLLERQQIPESICGLHEISLSQTSDIPKSALWFEGFIQ